MEERPSQEVRARFTALGSEGTAGSCRYPGGQGVCRGGLGGGGESHFCRGGGASPRGSIFLPCSWGQSAKC